MRVAAVIGSPVAHSLSPTLHTAAFQAAGLDWVYVAFEVAPGRGGDAVRAMRTLGIAGLAVTMPHKPDVAAAVDEVDPAAKALASVNTVALRDDGTTFGASTDGAGLVASLRASGVALAGARIAVLGAGAAARSVIDAIGRAGASEIVVVNRSADRAAAVVTLAERARVGEFGEVGAVDVLINATSVGMGTSDLPLDPRHIGPSQVVVDLVYHPLETALLAAARERGAMVVDGLGMLVHQAALQQVLWTGIEPDVTAMRAAAEAELATRPR